MIEIRTESSFHQCDPATLADSDASEIAQRLVTSVEESLLNTPV